MSTKWSPFTLKRFIPAGQGVSDRCESIESSNRSCPQNGDEISSFYENLVINSTARNDSGLKPAKPSATSSRSKRNYASNNLSNDSAILRPRPDVNHFLYCAQIDNVSGLEHCLQQGIDVNVKDSFGWSALMCSACSGATSAVKYLLEHNADQRIYDKTGMTAWKIAHQKGHVEIIDLLVSHRQFQPLAIRIKVEKPDPVENPSTSFVCETCKETIKDVPKEKHLSSTLHQFNSSKTRSSGLTQYHIPESNVGFQLMLKEGWNREQGLGPSGSGNKYPPKTVLKRDRQGFGGEVKLKAKITHFGPKDTNAVRFARLAATKQGTACRRERLLNEKLARHKEIEFRRQWHSLD